MPKPKPKHPERDRAMVDITPELRDRLAELAARNYRTVRAEAMLAIDEHLRRYSSPQPNTKSV